MPEGRRQLFVYWRVAMQDLPAALQATRRLQRQLRRQHPALTARLFQRHDVAVDAATLMETYAIDAATAPEGVCDALQQRIEAAAVSALQSWIRGVRHVEAFDALDG